MGNMRGAALMTASMLLFAIEDLMIKLLAGALPAWQIILIIALGGSVVFCALMPLRGQAFWSPAYLTRAVVIRNLAEVIGTLSFLTALTLAPLSSVTAILQSAPLFVALGAVVFLGETVGWRRWSAIIAGFLGVLLIIRPGLAGFDPLSLYALTGTLALAVRDLATRVAPKTVSSLQLSFLAYVSLVPAALLMGWWTGAPAAWPGGADWILVIGIILVSVLAYATIVAAMRVGDLSFVTGFRYSRLIFALVLATLVLGERPDAATLLGAAIIVAAGLYTLIRERKQTVMR
ncbi:MAG: DMT family transporter [Marinibacterium sp.]|nr:DMT family transporter [Marinibacterium sp.]